MLAMLDEVNDCSELANPYLGDARVTRIRAALADLGPDGSIPERWLFNVLLGKHELRLGNDELALRHYLKAHRLLGQSTDSVPRKHYLRTMFETGVAYLRWGENQNCVENYSPESCIFPIQGQGVHVAREGSSHAIHYFNEVLKNAAPNSTIALRSRWLLTIAQMTLGDHSLLPGREHTIDQKELVLDKKFPRFPQIASRLGLDSWDLAGGAIAEDFDSDGLLDVMVSSSDTQGQLRLFRNDGDGHFSEKTSAAGLVGLFGGLNLVQADYNNDGHVDVLVLRGGWWRQLGRHPNSLLRNNGDGTFTDVTFESGLGERHYPTQTAAWADFDLDGHLDLYIGNENGESIRFDEGTEGGHRAPGQLFRNDGDGTFTDVTENAGVENMRYAKGVVWGDYDNDGYPDLYVSNHGQPNRLYHNDQDGTFTDLAPNLGVTEPISSFATWFWDANNDGFLDLFVTAYGGPSRAPDVALVAAGFIGVRDPAVELSRIYLGDGKGGFKDVAPEWGLDRPTLPMGANFGDLDNDGFPDFYLGTGYPYYEALMPNMMYRNRDGSGFDDVTTAGGFGHLQKGHGVVFADLDNDGDQDVYEQMGGAYPGDAYGNALFLNTGFGNRWIKLQLVGVITNRAGIGARIRVDFTEHGRTRSVFHRVNSGGSFGANPLRAEIGVGRATRIERLQIHWPASGQTQTFEDVPLETMIEVTEGQPNFREVPLKRFSLEEPREIARHPEAL
jgi:hypothetical protein